MVGRAGFIAYATEQAWSRGTSGWVFCVDREEGVRQPEGWQLEQAEAQDG